ncbi:hypothetical protein GCM10007880_65020 [Mesorhizobium amorphae]|nr:hypothetical protein GCM10007880_65020 [Mesorhizobium amorphae]
MITRHSPLAHSAYHDLLSSLRDEVAAEIRGTPTRRNGRVYWYDTYRVDSDVKKTYSGKIARNFAFACNASKHCATKDDLREALEDALPRGKRWRDRTAATLERSPTLQALAT